MWKVITNSSLILVTGRTLGIHCICHVGFNIFMRLYMLRFLVQLDQQIAT